MRSTVECLEEQQLLELANGELTGDAARRAHDHLDACAVCRRVLAGVCGAPAEADRRGSLPPGATVDRYVIREPVGAGGMGVVYAAHDPELDREIALKLVRDDAWASGSRTDNQARLIREARAIAKLAHPNVVAVYDAGRHVGAVYVAMELVSGADLARWLRERERPWQELHGVLVAAGRGLAAAHAAGLVHRDFKPANVLVGADGRARVGDFGLARTEAAADRDEAGDDRAGEVRVTRTGAVAGTPSYMAPEQFEGTATAASDQFSFCATAYEALYGVRPFPGETIEEIRARIASGPPEPPRRDDAPASVRRALLRGLARDPAARHPSMEALLAALAPPRRRRATFVVLGAAIVATVTATWAIARREAVEVCADPAPLLAGVWDDAVALDLERTFLATGVAHAGAAWAQTRRTLDAYAAGWIATRHEACRATRVRREQPEEVYQRRLACLDQRRTALEMLARQLAMIDAAKLDGAARAAADLARVEDCTAPAYLAGFPSAAAPGRASAWQDLELGRALFIVQSHDQADAVLERVVQAAETSDDKALRAEALVLRGRNDGFRNDLPAAVRHLSAGVELAGELGADRLRVEGWAFLSNALQRLGRFDEAARLLDLADAALRAAPDPAREIDVLSSRGMLHGRQSRYREAAEQFGRAVELLTQLYGAESPKLTPSLRNLSTASRRLGRLDEALALARRAFEIDRVLGEDSPKLARARTDIAVVLSELGRYDESLAELARAGAALRRAHGDRHLDLASVEGHTGVVLLRQRRTRAAIEHLRTALAIRQELAPGAPDTLHGLANLAAALIDSGRGGEAEPMLRDLLAADVERVGSRHVDVAERRLSLGMALRQLGRTDDARQELDAARALFVELFGESHARVADVLVQLAALERERRRHRAALTFDRQAQAIRTRALPPEHPAHADALGALALDHLGLGSAKQAHDLIEQTIELRTTHGGAASSTDRWILARTLWATGERARAVALARELRAELAAVTEPDAATRDTLRELDRWLSGKPE